MKPIKVASPCHESWEAMNGAGGRRFCGVCQEHVHDLSSMGHDEAQALLQARSGERLCVRYTAERDGSLRFRDLVPRASVTRKIVRVAFAASMMTACARQEVGKMVGPDSNHRPGPHEQRAAPSRDVDSFVCPPVERPVLQTVVEPEPESPEGMGVLARPEQR
nr:hypothetical protein [Nannocystis sp.]